MHHAAWSGDVHGIVPVIPTPFDAGEEINLEDLERMIGFAASTQVTAVCLPAYGSEFYKLSEAEKSVLLTAAIRFAAGRVRIIAQSNHPSSKLAAEIAKRNEALGANLISFALPRMFAWGEDDLLRYSERVAQAVSLPILIQDFNPGGPTIGAAFAKRLKEVAPNFQYLKLEEPLMGQKVQAIRSATSDSVGVFEGWGGMHLLELMPAGIAGAMPGLPLADLLQVMVERARSGQTDDAFDVYSRILPHIVYSLQNMELFHHVEKRLLVARGLMRKATIREPSLSLDNSASRYIDLLIAQTFVTLDRAGLSRVPK